jgi:hypothetical protein
MKVPEEEMDFTKRNYLFSIEYKEDIARYQMDFPFGWK